jgi:flavin reductase (DIM6/NTAB) family NADH-FMN oxidoreductase RutF
MDILSSSLSKREAYFLLTGAVIPRPIALVTSLSSAGVVNAAPFSFFNAVSSDPPLLMLAIDRRRGERKDTARNILELREFVVNIVSESIAERMNLCSGEYPADVSEIDIAGFTALPSERIAVPRIAESPVQMECTLSQSLTVGRTPNDLLIGEVQVFHVADAVLEAGRISPQALQAVGRLSGSNYCRSTDVFRMERPRIGRGA